jgi:hypothetical protein
MRNSPRKFLSKTITKMKNPFNPFGSPAENKKKKTQKIGLNRATSSSFNNSTHTAQMLNQKIQNLSIQKYPK